MNTIKKIEKKKNPVIRKTSAEKMKKSKFTLYWESEREPGFEIIDMRAVLR